MNRTATMRLRRFHRDSEAPAKLGVKIDPSEEMLRNKMLDLELLDYLEDVRVSQYQTLTIEHRRTIEDLKILRDSLKSQQEVGKNDLTGDAMKARTSTHLLQALKTPHLLKVELGRSATSMDEASSSLLRMPPKISFRPKTTPNSKSGSRRPVTSRRPDAMEKKRFYMNETDQQLLAQRALTNFLRRPKTAPALLKQVRVKYPGSDGEQGTFSFNSHDLAELRDGRSRRKLRALGTISGILENARARYIQQESIKKKAYDDNQHITERVKEFVVDMKKSKWIDEGNPVGAFNTRGVHVVQLYTGSASTRGRPIK